MKFWQSFERRRRTEDRTQMTQVFKIKRFFCKDLILDISKKIFTFAKILLIYTYYV